MALKIRTRFARILLSQNPPFYNARSTTVIVFVTLSHFLQGGHTALSGASIRGYVEVAKALLEQGAATDLTDKVSLLCVVAQNGVSV